MHVKLKSVVKGALTILPGMQSLGLSSGKIQSISEIIFERRYPSWVRHLTHIWEFGQQKIPGIIAELGPGRALGMALPALLSGVNNYYAFDVVKHTDLRECQEALDLLLPLFESRGVSYSDVSFPSDILTDELIEAALRPDRIETIRQCLSSPNLHSGEISIKYAAPWFDENIINRETIDLVISTATMEHVADLDTAYRAMSLWLKPGGLMSHVIDFKSHGLSEKWNGHWAVPEPLWKITCGKRPYLINRQPCSVHLNLIEKYGFKVLLQQKDFRRDGIRREQLSSNWRGISDDDLSCSGVRIVAQKI